MIALSLSDTHIHAWGRDGREAGGARAARARTPLKQAGAGRWSGCTGWGGGGGSKRSTLCDRGEGVLNVTVEKEYSRSTQCNRGEGALGETVDGTGLAANISVSQAAFLQSRRLTAEPRRRRITNLVELYCFC